MSDNKISLCFIVNNFDCGGLEKVVINLINNLDERKFTIFLICLDGQGVLFHQNHLPEGNTLILKKKNRFNLHFFRKIATFFQANKIQLAHAHNIGPLIFAGIASKMVRPKPVVMYTEHNQVFRLDSFGKFKFKYIYLNLAQHVITCSHQLKEYYKKQIGIRREINVIHNGIDGSAFQKGSNQDYKKRFKIPGNKFVVGTAVVLSEQKGIKYLVEAAAIVSRINEDIYFIIAGDGPLKKKIQKQVDENNLSNIVELIGYCNEIPEFIAAIDIYVLPSLWEGLPLALLEGLAAGKPIVATSVGGNPEIVEDGVNGKIVPPRSPKAIAEAILDLYGKKNVEIQKIKSDNQLKFNASFSLDSMVENYSQFYRNALNKS